MLYINCSVQGIKYRCLLIETPDVKQWIAIMCSYGANSFYRTFEEVEK